MTATLDCVVYINTAVCTLTLDMCFASVSTKPSINYCLITAEVDVGSSVEKVEISCADESNPVVYSNVVATTVKVGKGHGARTSADV